MFHLGILRKIKIDIPLDMFFLHCYIRAYHSIHPPSELEKGDRMREFSFRQSSHIGRRISCLFWGCFFLLFAHTSWATSSKAAPTSRAAAQVHPVKPKSAKVKPSVVVSSTSLQGPLGLVYFANIAQSVRRAVSTLEPFFPKEVKALQKKFVRKVGRRFFPHLKNVQLHRAIQLIPSLLKPLGIDLERPASVFVMKYSPNKTSRQMLFVPVVMLSIDRTKLIHSLRLLGFSPRIQQIGTVELLTLGEAGPGSAFAVLGNGKLYFTLRKWLPRMSLTQEKEIRDALYELGLQGDVVRGAFTQAGANDVLKKLDTGALGAYALLPSAKPLAFIPRARIVSVFLKSAGFGLGLREGATQHFFVRGAKMLSPLFGLLAPSQKAADWKRFVPASTGWYGKSYIQIGRLNQLLKTIHTHPAVPRMAAFLIRGRYLRAKMALRSQGLDLDALVATLSGQVASGFVWNPSMQARISKVRPDRLFRGHMQGAFAMLGLNKPEDGTKLIDLVHSMYLKAVKKKPFIGSMLRIQKKKIEGYTTLQITPMMTRTFSLLAHDDFLLFSGDLTTQKHFISVWKGIAPSLTRLKNKSPLLAAAFPQLKGSYAAISPRVLLDLLHIPVPMKPQIKSRLVLLAKRLKSIHFNTEIQGARLSSTTRVAISPTPIRPLNPVYKGALPALPVQGPNLLRFAMGISAFGLMSASMNWGTAAAIAIPAFMKFTRKTRTVEAKLGINTLKTGAILWFDGRHANQKGTPLPKHFPQASVGTVNNKRQVFTLPKEKPCARGRAAYPKNPKIWNVSPWKELRFSMKGKHYYQYTYVVEGSGKNAKFTISAQGDLDCDGKLSLFEIVGRVNKVTGEVEVVRNTKNPLE